MRLFVAVWPPPEVTDAVAGLDRPDVPGLRWTTPDQWHVTLRFLGQCEVEDVEAVWGGVATSPVGQASMGPVTGRFGRRILHVPVDGLAPLAAVTVAATAGVGDPPEARPFSGHITLARSRLRSGVDLRPLCGVPLAGSWEVTEVTLVASHLRAGAGGAARYETVAVLPLGA